MTADPGRHGEWQAVHIFYAANPRPLLVQCVRPLLANLTTDGLIAGHFFINYWLEGPHVRLRCKPATVAATGEVRNRMARAVDDFLRTRPALYQVDAGFLSELYDALLGVELSEAERQRFTGPDGRMVLRQNNSYSFEPYEPEYGKYGGTSGVRLAEWHFRHSTDMVLEATCSMNLHLRTVLLGFATQLMAVMASCFLPDRQELVDYLDRYYSFWHRAFTGTRLIGDEEYESAYERMDDATRRRLVEIHALVAGGETSRLPDTLRGWAAHCRELRDRAHALATGGGLVFRAWDGSRDDTVTNPGVALPLLLSPYMHMTNNRLNVTIRDEAYLAYVLGRTLRESVSDGRAPA